MLSACCECAGSMSIIFFIKNKKNMIHSKTSITLESLVESKTKLHYRVIP